MSADILLDEIGNRGWLDEKVLGLVQKKVGGRGVDSESVARFLVDKGHITQEQADEALAAIGNAPAVEPEEEDVASFGDEAPIENLSDPFSSAEDNETEQSVDDAVDDSKRAKGGKKSKRKREKRRKKPVKKANEWDSPLMLIGGGALILLLLCGAGVYVLLLQGSGDDRLKVAEEAFNKQSYTQAIDQYQKFLEDFSSHEGRDLARVHLGLSRIRQELERNNYEVALERSLNEVPEIVATDEAELAQSDLSALLPRIASGLVAKADRATELSEINKYVGLTNAALELNLNNKYVPSQKRNKPEIKRVEEVLSRIERRRVALEALEQTLDAMKAAVAAGDVRPAYESHAGLVKTHPELAGKPELTAAIETAAMAEQDAVRFVDETVAPETREPETPIAAVVATADQRRQGTAPVRGAVVFQFQGVLYGLNAGDGSLLWRRRVGDALDASEPLLVEGGCIAIDTRRNELVRVNDSTGELAWRVTLDEGLVQPVLLDERVLVPSKSGRMHVVDSTSGKREGYLQFAQPLVTPPVVSSNKKYVYLVGEHSSVYTLSAADLSCLGVYYLGHAKGSIVAPPAAMLGRVLVAENDGRATSTLHVLAANESGVVDSEAEAVKIQGLSSSVPVVFGRRLAAVSDTGQIRVFEVSPEDVTAPLTELASRRPPRRPPSPRHAALVGRHFWVAGHGLAKYSIAPAGNRLPISEVRDPFRNDVFTSPLLVRGEVLLHARRRRGNPGLTIGATNTETGAAYWETDVATPPAGAPSASLNNGKVLHTSATGRVFSVDMNRAEQAGRSWIAKPLVSAASQAGKPVRIASPTDNAGALLAAVDSEWVLRVDANAEANWSRLPDRLACEPTRFAEGWLATLRVGQVFYLSSRSDEPPAIPFQPEVAAGAPSPWLPAGAGVVRGEPLAVATNGKRLYSLQLFPGNPPRLELISDLDLESPAATRVAVVGDKAIVGHADGSLTVYDAESLDALAETEPVGRIVWGPYAVGDKALVATTAGALLCYDLANDPTTPLTAAWRQNTPPGGLFGAPHVQDAGVVIAARPGALCNVSLADGAVDMINLNEVIATAPHPAGQRLAMATADGALLFVNNRP